MKLMLLGDVHGNVKFMTEVVIPAAKANKVDWIYQVGDFGYWEHTTTGKYFLDEVSNSLVEEGIKFIFIQGNHDKVSMIFDTYTPIDDFYRIRAHLWYAPNGTVWSPNDGKTNFIALGGAYSIDKAWRLKQERARNAIQPGTYYNETLWFPEEEMTDDQLDVILNNVSERIDVILAHDKPMASNPRKTLHVIPECQPNQRRLQKAVKVFQPKLFVHGHLHDRYTDFIFSGDDGRTTQVEGLGADVSDKYSDAWEFMEI
jgi:Icc-related predicted phosphoesterase